jgi:site-specific recombinase XerD
VVATRRRQHISVDGTKALFGIRVGGVSSPYGRRVRVVVTDHRMAEAAASRFGLDPEDVGRVLGASGVADGFPFLVHDDGEYDSNLNRILRLLPTYGVRSQRSIVTYAGVYSAFQRFLDERRDGKPIWEADRDDFQALYVVRRVDVATRQSKATWNLWVAALDRFYQVALDEGLVANHPLPRRLGVAWSDRGPVTVERNAAYESDGGQRPPKYLSLEEYRLWRRHGLLGVAPSFPRLRERNALFADVVLSTGLRLQEATSLLTVEVAAGGEPGPYRFDLGAATAKGDKTRRVTIPSRLRRAVGVYVGVERANTVAAARRRGVYDAPGWLPVTAAGPSGVHLASTARRRLRLHELDPRERCRLLLVDDGGHPLEPLALWLGEDGRPLRASAWQRVFDRANRRASAVGGVRADVHPHVLRHTFAVHMLGLLVQRVVNVALPDGLAGIAPDTALYTRVITDPLRQLQRLLGHATTQSTEVYLTCLDLAQRIVDGAIADLEEALPFAEYEVSG